MPGGIIALVLSDSFLALRFLFLLYASLWADPAQPAGNANFYLLEDREHVSPETAWNFFISGKFTRRKERSINAGFTTSLYWIVVEKIKPLPEGMKVEIGTAQINEIEFYAIENNEPKRLFVTGDKFPFYLRPEPSLDFVFPIDQEHEHYLIKIDKRNESLQLTFRLKTATTLNNESVESGTVIGLLTGLILLMLIFGAFLAMISREKVYFFYILYVACGWLYVLANLGYGYKYLWPDTPWFAERARPIFALLTIGFSIHFIEHYAGRAAWKWLHFAMYALAYFSFSLIILTFIPEVDVKSSTLGYYFQAAIPVLVAVYLILIVTTLAQKIARKNRMAMFYALSVLPIAVFSTLQLFYYSGGIDFSGSYLQNYGQATGYVLEAVILTFGLAYRFNTYRIEKEQLLMSINTQQARYAKAMIVTQETERRQIADQLHDVAGSLLSAAKLNLSSIREKNFIKDADASQKLTQAEEAVTSISNMLRNLSHALSPVMLDKVGFKQSVEKIVNLFNASGKIKIELEVLGFEKSQPELRDKFAVLYGILYELINNIAKHAKATNALVQLIEHDESIVMIVEDNGVGLDPTRPMPATHGLAAIQSKIHYLNGSVTFDNAQPYGLIITLEIPKRNDDQDNISG